MFKITLEGASPADIRKLEREIKKQAKKAIEKEVLKKTGQKVQWVK